MDKANDPYKSILNLIGGVGAAAGMQAMPAIGEIVTPPPALTISYNGMILDSKWLWIDEYWLQGHERNTKGHLVSATQYRAGGSGEAAFTSHNHDIHDDYTENIIMTDTWHTGDKVLMVPIVGQDNKSVEQFVILCKLVRLDGN